MQIEDKLEPLIVAEALELKHWREAMKREYQSLVYNNTWELLPLPPNRVVVSSKWYYKAKTNAWENVQRHKAKYVAWDSHNGRGSTSRK